MQCYTCNYADTKVIESREVPDGDAIRRRRKCPKCGARFTTYERRERPQLIIIKHDNSRELFDRAKLLKGLHRACEKTPITNMQLEAVVSRIENQLANQGEPEVSSQDVGQLVMQELSKLSDVAYVRFASVYRRFEDITGFETELNQIRKNKQAQNKADSTK